MLEKDLKAIATSFVRGLIRGYASRGVSDSIYGVELEQGLVSIWLRATGEDSMGKLMDDGCKAVSQLALTNLDQGKLVNHIIDDAAPYRRD